MGRYHAVVHFERLKRVARALAPHADVARESALGRLHDDAATEGQPCQGVGDLDDGPGALEPLRVYLHGSSILHRLAVCLETPFDVVRFVSAVGEHLGHLAAEISRVADDVDGYVFWQSFQPCADFRKWHVSRTGNFALGYAKVFVSQVNDRDL